MPSFYGYNSRPNQIATAKFILLTKILTNSICHANLYIRETKFTTVQLMAHAVCSFLFLFSQGRTDIISRLHRIELTSLL